MTLVSTQEQSDEQLMVRAQGDDTQAFVELYDRHAVRAFRFARFLCESESRAEEVVAESFQAIWCDRVHFRPENGSFQTWSVQVIRGRATDSARRDSIDPTEDEAISATLKRLPGSEAEVIALAYFGGLSHLEIAAYLALPPGTVKGRMRLGLVGMRDHFRAESAA